jgi:hypothetical protein
MLLRRQFGELSFERPRMGAAPKFSKNSLTKSERYAWYLPERDVAKLEADCLRLGNITFSMWVLMMLNEWRMPPSAGREIEESPRSVVRTLARPDEKDAPRTLLGRVCVG